MMTDPQDCCTRSTMVFYVYNARKMNCSPFCYESMRDEPYLFESFHSPSDSYRIFGIEQSE